MLETHEACMSREQALIRENGELEDEIHRLRMELHVANAERRLAMRALRLLEYSLSRARTPPRSEPDRTLSST